MPRAATGPEAELVQQLELLGIFLECSRKRTLPIEYGTEERRGHEQGGETTAQRTDLPKYLRLKASPRPRRQRRRPPRTR